ncbi:MAG: cupin domain-containing protein [Planctomycetota bacterium]
MDRAVRSASDADAARIDEDWGSLTWLASQNLGNGEGLTVGRVVIKAGHSNPRHSHSACEEVLYLLSGRLEHTVGDDAVVLEAGDTLSVGPGIAHNATALGDEDADMIVAYSSGSRDFQPEH